MPIAYIRRHVIAGTKLTDAETNQQSAEHEEPVDLGRGADGSEQRAQEDEHDCDGLAPDSVRQVSAEDGAEQPAGEDHRARHTGEHCIPTREVELQGEKKNVTFMVKIRGKR